MLFNRSIYLRPVPTILVLLWTVLNVVFFVIDTTMVADSMEHLTQWTFALQMVLWCGISVVYIVRKPIPVVQAWLLPITFMVQFAVAIGVTVMIPLSPVARDGIRDYGAGLTWTYNAYLHYVTFIFTSGYTILDLENISLLCPYGVSHLVQLSDVISNVFGAILFLAAYYSHFDPREVYQISIRNDVSFIGMAAIMVVGGGIFYGVMEYQRRKGKRRLYSK